MRSQSKSRNSQSTKHLLDIHSRVKEGNKVMGTREGTDKEATPTIPSMSEVEAEVLNFPLEVLVAEEDSPSEMEVITQVKTNSLLISIFRKLNRDRE
jgi:hypothetical protein